jgi:hypothetical protein
LPRFTLENIVDIIQAKTSAANISNGQSDLPLVLGNGYLLENKADFNPTWLTDNGSLLQAQQFVVHVFAARTLKYHFGVIGDYVDDGSGEGVLPRIN